MPVGPIGQFQYRTCLIHLFPCRKYAGNINMFQRLKYKIKMVILSVFFSDFFLLHD